MNVGALRKLQLDLHIEAKGLSFIICYFISCRVTASNSSISKSLFIKLSGYKWHSFHIVTYPSKESLWLVDFFKVKLISPLNLPWKIIVLFFILKLCFYYIYNFSNYFLKRFKNTVSNLINSFLKLFLPHDDKTVLLKFTGKL